VVTFARSGKTARWRPSQGSLLELAERAGVAPMSSCRSGVCGTCATRVLAGDVDYAQPPAHDIEPGEALVCVAAPHPGPHLDGSADREGVTLDL
jgi:ferredoxin